MFANSFHWFLIKVYNKNVASTVYNFNVTVIK